MNSLVLSLFIAWLVLALLVLVFSLRKNNIRISLVSYSILFTVSMSVSVAIIEQTLVSDIAAGFSMVGALFAFYILEKAYFERSAADAARSALRESVERFKDFAESASDRFWEMDSSFCFTFISGAGGSEEPVDTDLEIGKTRWECVGVDPETDKKWNRHRKQLKSHLPFRNFYYSVVDREGRLRHWRVGGNPVFGARGHFQGYRGTSTDVTAEFEAQQKAAEAQTRLADALENITEGFAYWDAEDTLVLCNQRYREMCEGFSDLLVPGMQFEELFRTALEHGSVILKPGETIEKRVEERMKIRRNRTVQSFVQKYSGDRWIQITESPLDDGGTAIVCTDVTELKRAERDLTQAVKMEAVGQLSGGLAHDFNNLLSVILGNLELLSSQVDSGSMQQRLVDRAIQGGKRAAAITKRLLSFSRKPALNPHAVNFSNLILGMEELLKSSLGKSIQLELKLEKNLWQAIFDTNAFETILLNLALNSRDAMPDGGKLSITTSNLTRDKISEKYQKKLEEGDYLLIQITDNGIGMPKEVVKKCFDPFFTTKADNKGSGLGLSMVKSFVKESGGEIFVQSTQNEGTIIQMYLPRLAAERVLVQEDKEEQADCPLANGERVLVVEDHVDVRDLTLNMLRSLSYDVVAVEDSNAAKKLLKSDSDIDLILSDIMLGGGESGFEFADKVRKDFPDLPIIFMSGYSERLDEDKFSSIRDVPLLSKPFTRRQLAISLKELLLTKKFLKDENVS